MRRKASSRAARELLGRRQAVGGRLGDAGLDLLLEAGDAHHEELVQVRAQDGEELDALEQRVARVARLLEHAGLELEQAELAVDVEAGVFQFLLAVDAAQPVVDLGRWLLSLDQGFLPVACSYRDGMPPPARVHTL